MDFDRLLKEKYHIDLNPQQREAVLTTEGPMLLLAVPGSGKTTVVTARCAYMTMCRGIPAESILTLTFNKAAQRDMESRFLRVFGSDAPEGLRFSTIHSFCYSVLGEYGRAVGRRVPRLAEDGKPRLLRRLYAEANDGDYLTDDRLEDLANQICRVKNSMLTDEQVREGRYDIRSFARIFSAYEQYKNENGCMDFDDMLDKALAVFRVKPEILERLREKYRYINVDEAQDTSKLQHAIIRMLAAPRNNLFMVGDEDQSIYTFRAADPQYLLEFRQVYPEAKILLMERNYRSTHAIVNAARGLIGKNTLRHSKGMNTGNEIGLPIEETALGDSSLLPAHIVERLGEAGFHGNTAVLFRENMSAVALMDALEYAGVPFRMREHRLSFFDSRTVRDILAYLSLAHQPSDINALRQIYYKLNARVTREQFEAASALCAQGVPSALDALMAVPRLRADAVERLKALKRELAALPGMKPGDAVRHIVDRAGYGQYLRKSCGDGYYLESLLHAVECMRSIAQRTQSYPAFLERIAFLTALAGKTNGAGDGAVTLSTSCTVERVVTLSTVHSAKGLEFDRVLVVDLFDGRFPSVSAIEAMEAGDRVPMEEERRLFYVAVTRARKQVELVTAGKIYGEKVKPSRFIRELLPRVPRHRVSARMDAQVPAQQPPKDAAPEPLAAAGDIEMGAKVVHKAFGEGVVMAYSRENGVVAVRFPKYGVKTLSAAFCAGSGTMMRKSLRENDDG